jgi:rRNA processing protein Krr1/Pno1
MAEEMSKSAKRRAAKKARDAAAVEEPAPAPVAAPTSKAAPKAAAPAPKAKAAAAASAPAGSGGYPAEPKAKAKAKAKATPEPAPAAVAEPKAKAKAKAKAEPKAEPEPKAAAKSKSKKADTKPAVKEEPLKRQESPEDPTVVFDDGSGDPWEVCTGLTKKQQKAKERAEEAKREKEKAGPQAVGGKIIPGMSAASAQQQRIPGMAVSQSVNAPAAALAAAKAAAAAAGASAAAAAAGASEGGAKPDMSTSVTIKVPDNKIGIVIGPKGSKIKMIQEKTGVTRIDTSGEVFTIMGPADSVGMAEMAINDLITKGYTALAYDDFSENCVNVHPNFFPELIGKQGVVIRKMKEELGVEMTIPKTGPSGKKWKVSIAGSAKNVEKAKEVINDIVMYYHHEITHPGEAHEELDIPSWAYAWIIGKAGSELRHIQNNYKVRVNIPREGISENDKVVVVGAPHDVTRAATYINKLMVAGEEQVKGRDRQDKADDMWGDEAPEEDWMKQYMYKR